eukprot:1051778-Pleurochrysis_carterae.AAC.1
MTAVPATHGVSGKRAFVAQHKQRLCVHAHEHEKEADRDGAREKTRERRAQKERVKRRGKGVVGCG